MDPSEAEGLNEDMEVSSERDHEVQVDDGPNMATSSRNSPDVNSGMTNRESCKDSPDSPEESDMENRENIRESPESPEESDTKYLDNSRKSPEVSNMNNPENSKDSPESPNASDTEGQRNSIESPENEPDTKNQENFGDSPDVKSEVKHGEHSNENSISVKSDMESKEERISPTKEYACKCPTCPRSFRLNKQLLKHMVSHARESKYVCHFCDKAFYGENTLKVHFKKHLKMQVSDAERIGGDQSPGNVICEVCSGKCTHVCLSIHENSRIGFDRNSLRKAAAKNHSCNICGDSFPHKRDLQHHKKRYHKFTPQVSNLPVSNSSICLICYQPFPNLDKLKEHVLAAHTVPTSSDSGHNLFEENLKFLERQEAAQKSIVKMEPLDEIYDPELDETPENQHKKILAVASIKADPDLLENVSDNDHASEDSVCSTNEAFKDSNVGPLWDDVYKLIQAYDDDTSINDGNRSSRAKFSIGGHGHKHKKKQLAASVAESDWEQDLEMTSDGRVKCPSCPKTYGNRQSLKLHMWNHTGHKPYKCDVCDKSFGRIDYLRKHKAIHADRSDYVCKECGASFKVETSLNAHMQESHGCSLTEGRYKCPSCPKTYNSKESVKLHIWTHIGRKPYECEVCGKTFGRLDSLKKHTVVHSDARHFVCGECGTHFKLRGSLRQHLRNIHSLTLNKTAQCTVCDMNYSSKKSLKKHRQTHSEQERENNPDEIDDVSDVEEDDEKLDDDDEMLAFRSEEDKMYHCPKCTKTFERGDFLEKHLKFHEQKEKREKPNTCKLCGMIMPSPEELKEHEKVHECDITLDGRYICPKCPNTYSSRNAVKLHMWNHNGIKPYTCNVCDKSFGRVDYLRRHKQDVHRNKPPGHTGNRPSGSSQSGGAARNKTEKSCVCSECGMAFKIPDALRKHMYVHQTERPFKCTECEWAFKRRCELDVHMMRHKRIYPFVCDLCGKGTCTSTELRAHKRIHTGEKPYGCKQCTLRFSHVSSLVVHRRRVHEQVKPFLCSKCPRAFYTSTSLKSHFSVHSTAKRYRCKDCNKAFKTKRDVKRHERNQVCLRGKSRNRTPDTSAGPAPLPTEMETTPPANHPHNQPYYSAPNQHQPFYNPSYFTYAYQMH